MAIEVAGHVKNMKNDFVFINVPFVQSFIQIGEGHSGLNGIGSGIWQITLLNYKTF